MAAGFKQSLESPWYSKSSATVSAVEEDTPSKDVWVMRIQDVEKRHGKDSISDPLAAMRQGAAQVRQVERERKHWPSREGEGAPGASRGREEEEEAPKTT